jgi:nitronate monooxygenase
MSSPSKTAATPSLLERLKMSVPVIQAPMAGVSTPALAAAVSNAGGLGSLGLGAMQASAASEAIKQTRALTKQPFGVNLFCHPPARPNANVEAAWLAYLAPKFAEFGASPPAKLGEIYTSFVVDDGMLECLLAERPDVVSFHFGLPDASRIAALKKAGITLMATATTLEEADMIEHAGIDAIVAQGIEAGGHRGTFDTTVRDSELGTLALVRLLVTHVGIPVIAAGGIMDGAGIAAVLALGAQAAQLGTAFVCCPESAADAAYRQALLTGKPITTTFTHTISGRIARGIANQIALLADDPAGPPVPDYPIAYDAGKALHAAAKACGNHSYAAHWAGQAAQLSRGLPAATLVAELRRELEQSKRIY